MALPSSMRLRLAWLCVILIVYGCERTEQPMVAETRTESADVPARVIGIESKTVAPESRGEERFNAYCAACHRRGGQGTEGRVPPLNNSPWVSGPQERLIRIVLNGLHGPIEIHGEIYNLEMPAFRTLFRDDDIAAVLSHVRQRYGAPSPNITAKAVARVRKSTQNRTRYWTVEELLRIPE